VGIERSGLVERCLHEIASVCKEVGVPFVVFVFQYVPGQHKQKMDIVRNFGLKEEFPVFSTHDFFKNQEIDDLKNSIVDSHPNSFGHRLLANGIYYKINDFIGKKKYQLNDQDLERKSIELKEFRDNFVHQ